MVNKVTLIGNLGDDVKMHKFDNGNCIGNFPVATSLTWKNKEGEKQTKTSWHNIVVSNKMAELCAQYLSKGSKVYIEGSIDYRQWEDKEGAKRYTTEIRAREVKFLDSKGEGDNTAAQPKEQLANKGGEDDLPF